MYIDTFLYAFLAWYIDNVFPGEFGIPQPFYFFLTKRYWMHSFGWKDSPLHESLLSNFTFSTSVEAVGEEFKGKESVVIRGLKKTFVKGLGKKFTAVDGLDLTMYDNQITAFLGHNGAGMPKYVYK